MGRYNGGFSLTESLLAAGLLGGMALVGAKLFENQSKGQKQVETSYEIVNIVQAQRLILNNVNNCSETFRGQNPASGTVTALKRQKTTPPPPFEDVYAVGDQLPANIKVLSYQLDKVNLPISTLETHLRVTYSRGLSAVSENSTKLIRLAYTLDAANNIDTCYAVNGAATTFWIQSGVDLDDIYYSGGEVGIGVGMNDPQHALDLAGNFRATTGADSVLLSGLTLQGSGPLTLGPSLTVTGDITSTTNINTTGALSAATATMSTSVSSPTMIATTVVQSPSFQYTSDKILKDKILPLDQALSRIEKLHGVEFVWKNSGEKDMGFIAQEVLKTEPTLVGTTEDGIKTVKYGNINALLVEAIKELQKEVKELRLQVKTLENKIKVSK